MTIDPNNVRRLTSEGFGILGIIPLDDIPEGPQKDKILRAMADLNESFTAISSLLDEMEEP